jgi:hypothetical protein
MTVGYDDKTDVLTSHGWKPWPLVYPGTGHGFLTHLMPPPPFRPDREDRHGLREGSRERPGRLRAHPRLLRRAPHQEIYNVKDPDTAAPIQVVADQADVWTAGPDAGREVAAVRESTGAGDRLCRAAGASSANVPERV